MSHNVFSFGDTYWLQLEGTAMGTSVAVMYANIYCSYRERTLILPKYKNNIIYYKRYVDDVFSLWRDTTTTTWKDLAKDLPQGILKWIVQKPECTVNFLDITVTIDARSGKISTESYQKPMNLHLYLPASSAHPPGSLKGLIVGILRRYWLQNSNSKNYRRLVTLFAAQLLKRGYSKQQITESFNDASKYLRSKHGDRKIYLSKATLERRARTSSKPQDNLNNTIIYHAEFHPRGVPRKRIQQIYGDTIQKTGLFDRQIVAFSRPKNLRDLLSPSTLPQVGRNNPSDFIIAR